MACVSVYRNLDFLPELLEHCLIKGTWYHIPHRSTLRISKTIQASTFLLTWEQGDKMMNIYEGLTLTDECRSTETLKYVHIVMKLVIHSFNPEKHCLLGPFSCS